MVIIVVIMMCAIFDLHIEHLYVKTMLHLILAFVKKLLKENFTVL